VLLQMVCCANVHVHVHVHRHVNENDCHDHHGCDCGSNRADCADRRDVYVNVTNDDQIHCYVMLIYFADEDEDESDCVHVHVRVHYRYVGMSVNAHHELCFDCCAVVNTSVVVALALALASAMFEWNMNVWLWMRMNVACLWSDWMLMMQGADRRMYRG
jgi:hypothetical protein